MNFRGGLALILVVFLSLSLNIASAANTGQFCITAPGGLVPDLGSCMQSAVLFASVGLLFSFSIIAIAYLLGQVMKVEGLVNWWRTELWEVTKSIIVLILIFAVILVVGQISNSLSNNACPVSSDFTTLYCNAQGYLNGETATASNAFGVAVGISVGTGFLKSIQVSTYFPVPNIVPCPDDPEAPCQIGSTNFGSDELIFVSTILGADQGEGSSFLRDLVWLLIVPMYMVLSAQSFLFGTIVFIGLGILIPLGIAFRALPFLRGIGGALIALGIGAAIIYPILLVIINIPISSYFSPLINSAGTFNGCGQLASNAAGDIICYAFLYPTILTLNPFAYGLSAAYGTAGEYGYYSALASFTSGSIYPPLNALLIFSIPLLIQLILFGVDLLFGIALMSGIANLLGGSLRLSIGNFKLV